MRFERAFLPGNGVWSSPFARWQGALAGVDSLDLAVAVATRAAEERALPLDAVEQVVFGQTVPQASTFYGPTTLAGRLGLAGVCGPLVSQACATSVAGLQAAAVAIEYGDARVALVVTTDRTSNGPLLTWPAPGSAGGRPTVQHWVLDSFALDPWGGTSMVATADAVAAEAGFTRRDADEITLVRAEQYRDALAGGREFQRRYMVDAELTVDRRRIRLTEDDGVHATTADGLAKLAPVHPEGVTTFGSQTHPADGTAGALITDRATAARDGVIVQLLATGSARVERARMPKAPVPAARRALDDAGLTLDQIDVVKTHNPFAVNDLWFARETGLDVEALNPYGCSLVYGHPQGPTGLRAIAELVAALALRGGGTGLFTGCAAGDAGAAAVLRVQV
ncbi:MAG: thiolase family protein [Acidimicrobiia bacterium]